MTADPEITRIVRSWLEDGVTSIPDRVLDAVMADLSATPQRRRWMQARRDVSMNNYARLAAVMVVVSILVIGGIALTRPSLIGGEGATPVPTTSATNSPPAILPLAPSAWCDYVANLGVLGVPGPPYLPALEAALAGDPAEWRRVGPDFLALVRETRSALTGLEGLAPIATAVEDEALKLDNWIAALDASLASDAGRPEITRIYETYAVWQSNRVVFNREVRRSFELNVCL